MSHETSGPVGLIALWRRWYRGDGALTDDSAMFAAALAALNLMGATLSVLWLLLPHQGHANELTIVGATLAAYALGTFLVLGRRAKPWWMFQLSIALDTLVISIALIATGDPGSVYAFYYLWATLYAVCFFSPRMIALQAVWVCTAYAGSLAVIGSEEPAALISQWLLPMVTLLAAGTLVRQLTRRLRRGEATMRHDAGHDPLTGLPNRARFGERLESALAGRGDDQVAVAFIDLDHFKRVNDSLGHAVGDALLVAVAERLREHAEPTTLLARFGGDEFLALFRGPGWEGAAHRLLDAFERPFRVTGYEFAVTASVGVAPARRRRGRRDRRRPRRHRGLQRQARGPRGRGGLRRLDALGRHGPADARVRASPGARPRRAPGGLPADREPGRRHGRRDRGVGALDPSHARPGRA